MQTGTEVTYIESGPGLKTGFSVSGSVRQFPSKDGVGRCYLRSGDCYKFVFKPEKGEEQVLFRQDKEPTLSQLIAWIGVARQIHFQGRI